MTSDMTFLEFVFMLRNARRRWQYNVILAMEKDAHVVLNEYTAYRQIIQDAACRN